MSHPNPPPSLEHYCNSLIASRPPRPPMGASDLDMCPIPKSTIRSPHHSGPKIDATWMNSVRPGTTTSPSTQIPWLSAKNHGTTSMDFLKPQTPLPFDPHFPSSLMAIQSLVKKSPTGVHAEKRRRWENHPWLRKSFKGMETLPSAGS